MEKISVAVRFRPPNPVATDSSQAGAGGVGDREWRIDDTRVSLLHRAAGPVPDASFAFDHVFDGAATNERIYGTLVRDLIGAAVGGFNGTAFAYGQTSSGKTFTMNGSDADPGIIPRSVRDVFDTVRQILTDAALLKRQKLEIEELCKKLQGSHSEGLEQVVLKLRNDMHKSELERDRLAMELEDERKLRMTLEQHLTEQQKKLEATSSDHFTDSIGSV